MKFIIYFFISLTIFTSFSSFAKKVETKPCTEVANDPPTNLATSIVSEKKPDNDGSNATDFGGKIPGNSGSSGSGTSTGGNP